MKVFKDLDDFFSSIVTEDEEFVPADIGEEIDDIEDEDDTVTFDDVYDRLFSRSK